MKTPSVQEIKEELNNLSVRDLTAIALRLAKFKKENKELLSYLLFSASNENEFIEDVKSEIDKLFADVNRSNLYLAKKTIRKVLRHINVFSRYTPHKATELEFRIYFCEGLHKLNIDFRRSQVLLNLYNGQVKKIHALINGLHEDQQLDYLSAAERL